jgi:hypothetical protein
MVNLGGPPQGYILSICSATAAASDRISGILRAWATANNYAGMTAAELAGCTEHQRIRTTRERPAATVGAAVRITVPADGAVTSANFTARGTYTQGLAENIWVLVWPAEAPGRGWPQSPNAAAGAPAVKVSATEWSVPVTLGGPPQSYVLRAYTADANASSRLGAILADWVRRNDYPGLIEAELPAGLVEQHRITIRR